MIATGAAVAVRLVAHSLLDISLRAKTNGDKVQEVGLPAVVVATLVVGLAAWGLPALLDQATAAAHTAWAAIASVVFLLSLLGPAGAEGTSTKAPLACMHLVVALVLIPGLGSPVPHAGVEGMATALSLRKRGGTFVLDGSGTPTASLEFGRGMRTGTITVGGEALPIQADAPPAVRCHARRRHPGPAARPPVMFSAVLQEGRWPPGPAWLCPPVEQTTWGGCLQWFL
ncbi:hypothetical protein QF035_002694 [Streptomyces umbrinus]|uniref:Uncharacterized protein n=1 Tax=Streptomyces umbrinus TaxID=67370 RepID=A0ABU0SNH8_9ACTN|nr:hypothetical protein [Streptomyces umbrinus]